MDEPITTPARLAESLSLYHICDELTEMLMVYAEMKESGEDTTNIDQQIKLYAQSVPIKADAVAHVRKHFASQEQAAEDEERRLRKRKYIFRALIERLDDYIIGVLEKLPQPRRGSRRLEGNTATLSMVRNGGMERLIYDEAMVPNEYCRFVVRFTHDEYLRALELIGSPDIKAAKREVDTDLLREALAEPCPVCGAANAETTCSMCAGSGQHHVPGARLELGFHVRVT